MYVYGDKNRQLYSKLGELAGFTGSAVSIKRGNCVYVYDEKGCQIGAHYSKWLLHQPGPIPGLFYYAILVSIESEFNRGFDTYIPTQIGGDSSAVVQYVVLTY